MSKEKKKTEKAEWKEVDTFRAKEKDLFECAKRALLVSEFENEDFTAKQWNEFLSGDLQSTRMYTQKALRKITVRVIENILRSGNRCLPGSKHAVCHPTLSWKRKTLVLLRENIAIEIELQEKSSKFKLYDMQHTTYLIIFITTFDYIASCTKEARKRLREREVSKKEYEIKEAEFIFRNGMRKYGFEEVASFSSANFIKVADSFFRWSISKRKYEMFDQFNIHQSDMGVSEVYAMLKQKAEERKNEKEVKNSLGMRIILKLCCISPK
jgi:hypothetical protein